MKIKILILGILFVVSSIQIWSNDAFGCASCGCRDSKPNQAEIKVNNDHGHDHINVFVCPKCKGVVKQNSGKCSICGTKLIKKEMHKQENCPIMGGKIDKNIFADHNGLRIYFCCNNCIESFKKDPAKYINDLREKGIEPEKTPKK